MARVKRGVHTKKKHKAVMDRAKGFRGARSRRFKVAKEAIMHAERYAYRDRRARKGDFRKLWITRINAAARMDGLSYSRFMHGLKLAEVTVDRKNLADLAVREPEGFSALVAVAKEALGEDGGQPSASGSNGSTPSSTTTTAADVVEAPAGTDTVGSVEADRIVDDATAPEASEEAREAVTDDAAEGDDEVAAHEAEAPAADQVAVDVDEEVEAVDADDAEAAADDSSTGDPSVDADEQVVVDDADESDKADEADEESDEEE